MSRSASTPGHQADAPAAPIPPQRHLDAAERLLAPSTPDRQRAARRFVEAAPAFGIDFDLGRATAGPPGTIRQVALIVPSPGRTATTFLSGPGHPQACGTPETQHAERTACLRAIAALAGTLRDEPTGERSVEIVQGLPEPGESWAVEAYKSAGFERIAGLAYLRRPLRSADRGKLLNARQGPTLPEGWTLRSLPDLGGLERARSDLRVALDRSYEGTLDCPGLCGMRQTDDVIDSHKAAGHWDPGLWFILYDPEHQPTGALLCSASPESGTVELVYIGLAPTARGKGIARTLVQHGIGLAAGTGLGEFACAVDEQNTPAQRLYAQSGFTEQGRRVAFVKPVSGG